MRHANGTRIEILTLAGLLFLALSATPASAGTGYSVFDNRDLVAVDLASGAVEVLGELAIGTVSEVALDDGDLFVVAQQAPASSLYRIDLETTVVSPVGVLGDGLAITGLTFDTAGTLWMSTRNALYTVDPATAATTLIGATDRPIVALAARGSELFGLTTTDVSADLVAIDPDTAGTSVVATLPDIFFNGGLLAGLAFDLEGFLWAYTVTLPPIEPHILLQTFYEIGEPSAPEVVRTFSIEAPFVPDPPLFSGLVVAPGAFEEVAGIPTLDPAGWLILAALLLGAGLWALRRGRQAT